ncbi:MAG TPA: tripartite tricarboxylate transporter substrate-binding protein [Casimicrobiaceae bacterium]|nr:tripartite tricarboxylate transporter substrate-binding protein [Casimicrobiaceae bacterium]
MMRMRTFVGIVVTAFAVVIAATPARAAWPEHPIKMIVPFPAGGQLDVVVRVIADRISPALGQPIVVEVHTGADGNIAAEMVAKSAPDGYTWLSTSVPFTTQAALQPGKLRYDALRDFAPVANLGTASFVLVVPDSVPVSTLKEFIAYAKARPGALSYAGTSPEIVHRINAEVMKALASPEVLAKYRTIGVDPVPAHTPDEFGAMLRAEIDRWGKVIRDAHVTIQ